MTEAMHTTLPWRTSPLRGRTVDIVGGYNAIVARVLVDHDKGDANANLIVTAVNERPALLKQIAELKEALEYALRKNEVPGADLDGTNGYQMPSDHWMAKARAALANTKGDRMIRDQVAQFISGKGPWVARCASDKDANWPFWFIADATGLNVLDHYPNSVLGKFLPKGICQELAEIMNGRPE